MSRPRPLLSHSRKFHRSQDPTTIPTVSSDSAVRLFDTRASAILTTSISVAQGRLPPPCWPDVLIRTSYDMAVRARPTEGKVGRLMVLMDRHAECGVDWYLFARRAGPRVIGRDMAVSAGC